MPYIADPSNPGWVRLDGADAALESSWWQIPDGFVADPNNQGWYYLEGSDVAQQSNWVHDPSIEGDEPDAFAIWSAAEIGQAASVGVQAINDNWPSLSQALTDWGINTPLVAIGLVGTIMKESGSFYPVEEAWWLTEAQRNAYYADNTKHAVYQGGPEWHGRGYIQATHKPTYQAFYDAMVERGLAAVVEGLMDNPPLMLTAEVAAQFAAWYFVNHGYPPEGMVAACEARAWDRVRKAVYGGADADGVAKIQTAEGMLLPIARAKGLA